MSAITNYSNAIFLINPACRAMLGIFEADEPAKNFTAKREVFKTFDKDIRVGDLVQVQTHSRHKVSVIKIVDADIEVNFQATEETRWIIGKVDLSEYERLIALEQDAISKIKAAELRKQRDDLRKTMFADHLATISELEIATMAGDVALPAPSQPAE